MRTFRRLCAWIMFAGALAASVWGWRPLGVKTATASVILPGLISANPDANRAEIGPAARLVVAYPPVGRSGDPLPVQLTLELADHSPQLPEGAWFQARLDLLGAIAHPAGQISAPLTPRAAQGFSWEIRPASPGTVEGELWSYLLLSSDPSAPQALAVQTVAISVQSLFGLSGAQTRIAGAGGFLLGFLLFGFRLRRA